MRHQNMRLGLTLLHHGGSLRLPAALVTNGVMSDFLVIMCLYLRCNCIVHCYRCEYYYFIYVGMTLSLYCICGTVVHTGIYSISKAVKSYFANPGWFTCRLSVMLSQARRQEY